MPKQEILEKYLYKKLFKISEKYEKYCLKDEKDKEKGLILYFDKHHQILQIVDNKTRVPGSYLLLHRFPTWSYFNQQHFHKKLDDYLVYERDLFIAMIDDYIAGILTKVKHLKRPNKELMSFLKD